MTERDDKRGRAGANLTCKVCDETIGVGTLGADRYVTVFLGVEGVPDPPGFRDVQVCKDCCNSILDAYAATFGTVEDQG